MEGLEIFNFLLTLLSLPTSHVPLEIGYALSNLGVTIKDDDTTDPRIIKRILKEIDLELETLPNHLESVKLLQRLITEKIPLKPLKETIFIGIMNNPPLHKTIIENQQLNIFNDIQEKYIIYFIMILHVITYLMANDNELEEALFNQIIKKRGSFNSGSTFWNFVRKFINSKGDIFSALKYISVDPFMFVSICFRKYYPFPTDDQLNQFIKEHHLTGFNATILKTEVKRIKERSNIQEKRNNFGSLRGNILEALTFEEIKANQISFLSMFHQSKNRKSVDNVKAGLALILFLEKHEGTNATIHFAKKPFRLDENILSEHLATMTGFWKDIYNFTRANNVVRILEILSPPWVNLYEAWNAAFLLRTRPEKDQMFLPKLFIPDTLCCKPENYLSARVISLWLTLQFDSAMRSKNIQIQFDVPNIKLLVDIFGTNNYWYAKNELLKDMPDVDLDAEYEKRIRNNSIIKSYYNAVKLIKS